MDKQLPQSLWLEAAERAIIENAENAPSGQVDAERKLGITSGARETFGAVLTGKKWQNGRVLRVKHLNGDPAIHAHVERFAKQWEAFANISFSFVPDADAEIRISYSGDNESWSYIGTDALALSPPEETMHYGWLTVDTSEEEVRRVVLHEFGHALGMIHEHQHPGVAIEWNKDAVYQEYARKGWMKAAVDSNLFARISAHETQFDAYDPESIMHYPVPPEFVTDGREIGWNTELSAGDRAFIARMYPKVAPAAAFPASASPAGQPSPGGPDIQLHWRNRA